MKEDPIKFDVDGRTWYTTKDELELIKQVLSDINAKTAAMMWSGYAGVQIKVPYQNYVNIEV